MTFRTPVFALPEHLRAKAADVLIADDERRFERIAAELDRARQEVSRRLDAVRRSSDRSGQDLLERDLDARRLAARLTTLRRFDLDLCLGRIVPADGTETLYIGRGGLADASGAPLLIDWRTPAAEPFFGATHADPMGLRSRRRYRWNDGRISDYWDEVFDAVRPEERIALDDHSAFIASLGSSRSNRMRDVLSTIQSDQDAVIRASSRGALVVDGGPGTGKTVVALHRAAYLMYTDARVARGGGVLLIGPHGSYLSYVADVLPGLGEESVHVATLSDLVPEGTDAAPDADPAVVAVKSAAELAPRLIDAAVKHYETPPTSDLSIDTPWGTAAIGAPDWADAFGASDAATPHNDARAQVWEELLEILGDQFDGDEVPIHLLRRFLAQSEELSAVFASAWPLLDPVGVVADLWRFPGHLRTCAPWLTEEEVRMLHRDDARAWTVSDLPFLDAARLTIGDPGAVRIERQRAAAASVERERMNRVVDDLIAADDGDLQLMSILRGQDAQNSLVDDAALPPVGSDALAGPFGHVIVDEAQELTDAQWRMLVRRCPSRSFTIVGDRAQARNGFPETWHERLDRVGIRPIEKATLTVNYRTPEEVMLEAEPVIRMALPDADVPVAIRRSGIPVRRERVTDRDRLIASWLAENDSGIACVIGDPSFVERDRVRSLSPLEAKGLEFDLVLLVRTDLRDAAVEQIVDSYVAMTRATRELILLDDVVQQCGSEDHRAIVVVSGIQVEVDDDGDVVARRGSLAFLAIKPHR